MTERPWKDDGDISLLGVGTTLLRHRWRIVRWMLVTGAIASIWALTRPAKYVASASFVPQANETNRAGLANLAGQFGVSLPSQNPSLSPDFYARLLKSRVLLGHVTRDTLVVREMGGKRASILDLLGVGDGPPLRREEQAVAALTKIVSTNVVRSTGVVEVTVVTRWPSVSLAIATSLVNDVNEFNQQTRQSQATAERKFVEGRLAVATADLRSAEDRLEDFLRTNRQYASSPELTFLRERLQREVTLQQQVYTSLTASYEEVRMREVRDTPVITVIEPPWVATMPAPRGRVKTILLALILGGLAGAFAALVSESMFYRRAEGDAGANEFVGTLAAAKRDVLTPARWLKRRMHG